MDPLLKKLNLKDQNGMVVLKAPEQFHSQMNRFLMFLDVKEDFLAGKTSFLMAFCTTLADVEKVAAQLESKTESEALIWICYPKGTSKRYKCEFNRDNGFSSIGALGYETVRMVAIDDDWSALRFKKTAFIKKMTRNEKMRISVNK